MKDRPKQLNRVLRQGHTGKHEGREGRRAGQEGPGPPPRESRRRKGLRKERRTFQETSVSHGRRSNGPASGREQTVQSKRMSICFLTINHDRNQCQTPGCPLHDSPWKIKQEDGGFTGSKLPWGRRGPGGPGDTGSPGQQVEQAPWGLPRAGSSQREEDARSMSRAELGCCTAPRPPGAQRMLSQRHSPPRTIYNFQPE